jgi:hypothetical protein
MNALKNFWERLFPNDRRKRKRLEGSNLDAFFWTGSTPVAHKIRDISMTGLYLLTEERWYPGTLLVITLQKKNEPEDSPRRSIAIHSKAVRWGEDGVGLEFVLADPKNRASGQHLATAGVDRKTLEKFLEGFEIDDGNATVDRVVPPAN